MIPDVGAPSGVGTVRRHAGRHHRILGAHWFVARRRPARCRPPGDPPGPPRPPRHRRDRLGPRSRHHRRRRARGRRRCRQPGRRRHRRREVDRGAQAPHPRVPHEEHRPDRPHHRRARPQAVRPAVRLRHRLLPRRRRRGPHRADPPRRRLPDRRVHPVGGSHRAGPGRRRPHLPAAHRDRAVRGRRGAEEDAAPLQARHRRPSRVRRAVVELDLHRRPRPGDAAPHRVRGRGAGEPDRAQPGHQPAVHQGARP